MQLNILSAGNRMVDSENKAEKRGKCGGICDFLCIVRPIQNLCKF